MREEVGGSVIGLAHKTKFGTTTMQYAPEGCQHTLNAGQRIPGALPIMPNELKMYSFDLRRGFLLPDRIMYCSASAAELWERRWCGMLTAFSTRNR